VPVGRGLEGHRSTARLARLDDCGIDPGSHLGQRLLPSYLAMIHTACTNPGT
jgi:hypothetical protein